MTAPRLTEAELAELQSAVELLCKPLNMLERMERDLMVANQRIAELERQLAECRARSDTR
jgi:hypothetical protein